MGYPIDKAAFPLPGRLPDGPEDWLKAVNDGLELAAADRQRSRERWPRESALTRERSPASDCNGLIRPRHSTTRNNNDTSSRDIPAAAISSNIDRWRWLWIDAVMFCRTSISALLAAREGKALTGWSAS